MILNEMTDSRGTVIKYLKSAPSSSRPEDNSTIAQLMSTLDSMNAFELAKQKESFIDSANKAFLNYYGDNDAEPYFDVKTHTFKKRSKNLARLLNRQVSALKNANFSKLRANIPTSIRDILDIYTDAERKPREVSVAAVSVDID